MLSDNCHCCLVPHSIKLVLLYLQLLAMFYRQWQIMFANSMHVLWSMGSRISDLFFKKR